MCVSIFHKGLVNIIDILHLRKAAQCQIEMCVYAIAGVTMIMY